MVIETMVEELQASNGYIGANVKIKTDKGLVGMRVTFETRKYPDLEAALLVMIQSIERTMAETIGVKESETAAA